MKKKETISQLRKAKTAHIRWRSYAQALVSGIALDEERVPIVHTDCEFGRWYYGDGQTLGGFAEFKAIALSHERLHTVYMELFRALFEPERGGLLTRLIGRRRSASAAKNGLIQQLLDELLQVSERLMGHIEALEQTILATDDTAIARLM